MQSLKKYVRGGVIALFLMALGSLLAYNSISAAPPATSTAPVRGYYLTPQNHAGNKALTACVAGYHMASVFEISDPSNLRYDTTLGQTAKDSGFGPPSISNGSTNMFGWIRSGGFASTVPTSSGGTPNCSVWTSNSAADYGFIGYFQSTGAPPNLTTGGDTTCDHTIHVWCVQN